MTRVNVEGGEDNGNNVVEEIVEQESREPPEEESATALDIASSVDSEDQESELVELFENVIPLAGKSKEDVKKISSHMKAIGKERVPKFAEFVDQQWDRVRDALPLATQCRSDLRSNWLEEEYAKLLAQYEDCCLEERPFHRKYLSRRLTTSHVEMPRRISMLKKLKWKP